MSMTISITSDIEYKLGRVASITNRDVQAVLDSLLSESVDEKLDRLAAIQEGLDDIEAGRVEDHDDVINEVLANIHEIIAAKS